MSSSSAAPHREGLFLFLFFFSFFPAKNGNFSLFGKVIVKRQKKKREERREKRERERERRDPAERHLEGVRPASEHEHEHEHEHDNSSVLSEVGTRHG